MRIGKYQLENNIILAPMAGVTDRPFRELCRSQGAGLAVSEMLSSNPRVWNSKKSRFKMNHLVNNSRMYSKAYLGQESKVQRIFRLILNQIKLSTRFSKILSARKNNS